MPRTRARSSARARAEFSLDSATRAMAASGSVLISPSVARSEMPSAIRRACAPSCRSRSTRRSSAAALSTASTRVTVSRRTRLEQLTVALGQPGVHADGARHQPHPEGQHDQPGRQVDGMRQPVTEDKGVQRVISRRTRTGRQ